MRGFLRRKNRSQAQQEVRFEQDRFNNGYIADIPGSDLPKDSMALLENFNAYPEYLEGRSGSQLYSSTALPGTGTIRSLFQHKTAKKFVLHRDSGIYMADSAISSWTTLLSYTPIQSVSPSGDTGGQLSLFYLQGVDRSNTNNGFLYWNLTNSGGTRTLDLYSNSGKTTKVATGSISGNGQMQITSVNASGLQGVVTVTYTGDDTDSGNTIFLTTGSSYVQAVDSTICPYKNDCILFSQNASTTNGGLLHLNLTTGKYAVLNSAGAAVGYGYGYYPLNGSGTQSATTPYGYRYIYTFSRITNSSGGVDTSLNRLTGNLVFESPSNASRDQTGATFANDYAEFWLANPISGSNSNTFYITFGGGALPVFLSNYAEGHFSHISLYRTLDIGVSGIDPVTGSGNSQETYVWVGDWPITQIQVTDNKTDAQLRSALGAGYGIKSRFWVNLPNGACGEVGNNFLYTAARAANNIYYCQLLDPRFIGYYNPAFQFMKLDDGVQVIAKSPDMISFICSNSTYVSSPNSYVDAGSSVTGPIYVLQHLTKASANIGCTDYGSFAPVDSANQLGQFGQGGATAFIARCSDNTIRIWNNSYWSNDLSSRRVNTIVQTMVAGSVGAYWKGVYRLYYRTNSGYTTTTNCLRFGMSTDGGFGWSQESGVALPLPQTYVGAGSFIDANGVQRMFCLDASDGLFYWIETFTSYSGSGLTKVFLDKVAANGSGGYTFTCKARFREVQGPLESLDLIHKEAHIFDRPYDESVGYPSGFSRSYLIYADGSSTASGTLSGVTKGADLQFFEAVLGKRLQPEVQFNQSGARLTGFEALFDSLNRANIGGGPSAYSEATYQADLAQNLKIWLTRPSNTLNRASGSAFTLTGTAPTSVSGPDGKTYALSFGSGASYSLAETTSYSNFSLHFWVKSATAGSRILQITGTNSFYVTFASSTSLSLNGAGSLTVSTIASGWHDFWIVRSGSTVTAYQNGAAVSGSVSVSTARGGTSFDINPDGAAVQLYDIRAYTTALSAADIAYYYASVTTANGGSKVLPLG
jgi:hypothetical protein